MPPSSYDAHRRKGERCWPAWQDLLGQVGAGNKCTLYQLTVETAQQLGGSAVGRLLITAEREAWGLEYMRGQGEITNREVQQVATDRG